MFSATLFTSCDPAKDKSVVIERNGNRIAYRICGNADTTLLFVHGWCINKEYWEGQVQSFCHRYKVVTIDLPGFGQSGKNLDSNWHFGNYSDDVRAVMEMLQLKNVVLIGHSMSGDIVLDMARRHPGSVAGIVGIDNLHRPADSFPGPAIKEIEKFYALMLRRYDSIVQHLMAKDLFQPSTDSALRKRILKDVLSTDPALAVRILKANTWFSQQEQDAMKALQHKLYLVNSDVFPVSADSLNKYCAKGFRVELIQGSGHYPMLEKPAAFNAALQKVLDDMSGE